MEHLDLITEQDRENLEQTEECLTVVLRKRDVIKIRGDLERQYRGGDSPLELGAKLQCFHSWLFYYLYSADYKFLKAILKNKFDFVSVLFGKDIRRLVSNENYKNMIRKVYSFKTM